MAGPEILSLILIIYYNYTVDIIIIYQTPIKKIYLKSPNNPLKVI